MPSLQMPRTTGAGDVQELSDKRFATIIAIRKPAFRPVTASLETRALAAHAGRLVSAGRMQDAETVFRAVLEAAPNNVEAHAFLADRAYLQGEIANAAARYELCRKLAPEAAVFPLMLGRCKEKAGDLAGAVQSYLDAFRMNPRDWRIALFAGYALEAVGQREEAAVLFTLGDDINLAVRTAKDDPLADAEIRERASVADRVFREFFTALHARAVDEAESLAPGADLSRIRRAIWTQTHDRPIQYREPSQQPSVFYIPDLEPTPTMAREHLPWAGAVEAATDEIRAEFFSAIQSGALLSPYIPAQMGDPGWEKLRGQSDWSALHLYAGARETAFAKAFPRTLAVLRNTGVLPLVEGAPVELFFSRLAPGAHIPPHFGCINSRLTVHLPLVVPDGCSIRVGSEVHTWSEGRIFAFDDSFEHEAWNRGNSERVVLIFEAHRPDLSPQERNAIEFVFSKRENWLRSRRIP